MRLSSSRPGQRLTQSLQVMALVHPPKSQHRILKSQTICLFDKVTTPSDAKVGKITSGYYADVWITPLERIAALRVKRIVKAKVGTELGWAARGNDYVAVKLQS
ncbi:hypothetical protein DAPPUDRAFT_249954 [Daphnia pulex]|uniref:Uncharacterized protein n=1 Tax=Daphnia pulex TaxID=6669 RepID=E9GXL9_DAPPU|nr:hypothetical protein DAPPUDRAFT_249954 [Daphnia pulex]|eukprot:EFX75682.1 hypothetical protein DAPPUDRAFT_249954 [Daphnia pulex]